MKASYYLEATGAILFIALVMVCRVSSEVHPSDRQLIMLRARGFEAAR